MIENAFIKAYESPRHILEDGKNHIDARLIIWNDMNRKPSVEIFTSRYVNDGEWLVTTGSVRIPYELLDDLSGRIRELKNVIDGKY